MRPPGVMAWLSILFALGSSAVGSDSPPREDPSGTDLLEKAKTRLAQIDVTVSGPPELLARLSPHHLQLKIGQTLITDFVLDPRCPAASPAALDGAPRPIPAKSGPSYLLYYDQPHLTLAGRQRSLDLSRQIVPALVRNGGRAMIVSNARSLVVVEEFTEDPEQLLRALERLEQDRTQWDIFAEQEAQRVDRVVGALNDDQSIDRAMSTARTMQREERSRGDKSLRRLALSLAHFEDIDPPKAVVYFADTMRQRAGEHYLSFFGPRLLRASAVLQTIGASAETAELPFDAVLDAAAAQGIRFYTVQAEGLVVPTEGDRLDGAGLTRAGTVPSSSRVRSNDARDTLSSLAGETGGQAFLRGENADKIAGRIERDFACTFLLSFDPTGLAEDAPLRVVIEPHSDELKLRSRGRIVLQSERTRRRARLLGAFALSHEDEGALGLASHLVPTGFEDGAYTALLQIRVPPTSLRSANWDLGATLLAGERVIEEVSGSLGIDRPGVPLVLERELHFRPGPHDLRSVAHETENDLLLSDRVRIDWPDPNERSATCGPIALLQPGAAAFVRGGETRTAGSLAHGVDDEVSPDSPVLLVGLVCRGAHRRLPLRVERALVGSAEMGFPPLEIDFGPDRCAQVRDLIPADLLGPGIYRYVVRLVDGETQVDEGSRVFAVSGDAR